MSANNKPKLITITADQAGQRIDNFLLKQLKGVPKSHIYRLLRSGQVRINSGRKKAHYKLTNGDILRLPPVRIAKAENATVPDAVINLLSNSILFENDNIIAINKPSGIAVHKGSGLRFGVIEAFRQLYPELPVELVHRLDRETSGCLLLAKNRQTLGLLHELLRDERSVRIEKTYLALVKGRWHLDDPVTGSETIDIGISKIKRSGEHMMQVDKHGDRAVSHFSMIKHFTDCSLMQVRIETGRTHQIRVHAAHTGHPIIGDSKYGDKSVNRQFRELGLNRLFLHAQRLYLPLADPITVEAALSEELTSLLTKLTPGE